MAQSAVLDPAPAAASRTGIWLLVALFCATHIAASLGQLVVVLLVPGIKASLKIDDTQVSLLNGAAFAICHAGALLVFGRLTDRWNRRNLLILGVIGWSLALFAGAFANTFLELAAARIALGIFQAVLIPTTTSILVDRAPATVRGRAIGIMASGGSVGAAVSLFLGGALLQIFSAHPPHLFGLSFAPWQAVLALCGLPSLALVPFLLMIREPARRTVAGRPQFRPLAYVRMHAGAFVPFLLACFFFLLAGFAQGGWNVVVLLRNLHMAPAVAGAAMGLFAFTGATIAAFVGGSLSDFATRRDPDTGRIKVLALMAPFGAVSVSLVLAISHPPVVFFALFLMSISGTLVASLAGTIAPELTPSEGRGQIMALFGLISTIGGLGTAPTLVALVTDHVLRDENKLPLGEVIVSLPAYALGMLFTIMAIPAARKLRRQVRETSGEA